MRAGDTALRVAAAVLIAREAGRRSLAAAVALARGAGRPFESAADRLVIAPPDIRTADPTVADDILAGRFIFSGQMVETFGQSPFLAPPVSAEWERVLHGFGWLRHLRAAGGPEVHGEARALIEAWLRQGLRNPVAWEPEVAGRRLISFLAQSPMLLDGCSAAFYRRFMAAIGLHARRLRNAFERVPPGLGRLRIAVALVAVAVAVDSFRPRVKAAMKRLDDELARQIFPDGGHVGRNPAALLEILVDLLPLRQAHAARGIPVSSGVMNAIDRMMHLLRFFRHGDGALALFNGAGVTPVSLVASVLVHDDALGRPPGNAPHSGYQRLEADRTVVIVDCGRPPPPDYARDAHAGPLAFEFSSGRNRFVVNCGAPPRTGDPWRDIARRTAAHSTVTVADAVAGRFAEGVLERMAGRVLIAGAQRVEIDRQEHEGAVAVIARHDAWLLAFGLIHERTLRLAPAGDRLDGRDRLIEEGTRRSGHAPFAIRFHLHPSIQATPLEGGPIMLAAPDGETWEFHVDGTAASVEDSVYLADPHGARRSLQLVVTGKAPAEIRWTFLRAAEPHGARRRT